MKYLGILSYIVVGALLGSIVTFKVVGGHLDFLTNRALMMSKMSFMLGCTLSKEKTIVDCQKEPGYTDNKEIFEKIENAFKELETESSAIPPEEKAVAPFKDNGDLSLV